MNERPGRGLDRIEAANQRVDRATGWFDRIVPLHEWRPLHTIPSIKVKLSILIVVAIGITVATATVGFWLDIAPEWSVLAAVGLALVLVQILARGITSPLREMSRAADRMAAGDLDQRVSATGADEVGQLGESFNAMAAHITELEQQRRDLIANVSHELRTPIAVLQGNVENMLDEVVDDAHDTLAVMHRQTQRLGRLVGQLIDLSRLEAGVVPLESVPMDLTGVIDRVVEEGRLHEPEPKFEVDAPTEVLVHGDPERLHQVFANVAENAIRFSPEATPITVLVEAGEGSVRVVVSDEGPGIDEADLDKVFERFHRAGPGRASATGGSGLGLAIARGIVELHGGSIAAANREPTGCAITVTLPLG